MVSFRSLVAAVPFVAFAFAQTKIAFTSTPAVAVAGESYNITWGGGDQSAVTLTLRRGDPQNLRTISTIADGIRDSFYIWTVPSSLPSASDYALQITQGQYDINYSGLFSISAPDSNSTSSTTSSMVAMTGASNSSMTMTAPASAQGTGTTMSRNTTFSTASLSSHSAGYTFGGTVTSSTSRTSSATATASSTSAPSNDAPTKVGSSAALVLGVLAAIMLN